MTILEASASCRRDATFQVPVPKLRSLRAQVQRFLDLPAADSFHAAWSILSEDLCDTLTVLEMHCALRGTEGNKEVHILRLKSLVTLLFEWPHLWMKMDDEDYFRVRCFQSDWTIESWSRMLSRQAEDLEHSQEEKYETAAKQLQSLSSIQELPEASWIASALDELRLVQAEQNTGRHSPPAGA